MKLTGDGASRAYPAGFARGTELGAAAVYSTIINSSSSYSSWSSSHLTEAVVVWEGGSPTMSAGLRRRHATASSTDPLTMI